MGVNFEEIAQKQDRLIANIAEQNRKSYEMFYSPTPADVTLPQYDENGQMVNVSIPNRAKIKKQMWDDVAGALGQLTRTYYVDAVNGNDTGAGTSTDPFLSIKKAVYSVPTGGRCTIYVRGDASILGSDYIYIAHKAITIVAHPDAPDSVVRFINNTGISPVALSLGASLLINIDSVLENTYDTSLRHCISCDASSYLAIGRNTARSTIAGVTERSNISVHDNTIISLVKSSTLYIDQVDFTLAAAAKLTAFSIVSASIFGSHTGTITIGGTPATESDILSNLVGIIRDANGVPRNVLSNIVL